MKKLIVIVFLFSFMSCNKFWNVMIEGEAHRKVYKNDQRRTIVVTYPTDSTSKIRVKERAFVKEYDK